LADSKYLAEAESILARARLKGDAKAAVVIVIGDPEVMGFTYAVEGDQGLAVRAALPELLETVAGHVREENKRRTQPRPA
jgi:class 3 adenylate cyclase